MHLRVRPSRARTVWAVWVVAALLVLPVVTGWAYLGVVGASGLLLALLVVPPSPRIPPYDGTHAGRDVLVAAGLYVAVVGLMRLAFVGFTTDHVAGLFLAFAAALLVGTVGPLVHTVRLLGGGVADLGLRRDDLRPAIGFALLFGAVQFALTLWGVELPAPVDWVPLLVMALVVGVFESVFFRGYLQGRLTASYGPVGGVAAASVLYGAYHVGYGMAVTQIGFLTGLGIVYAMAYAVADNLVVLWPLLTPLGSFFANLDSGDIELPWASIAGFADVAAVMALALWLTVRRTPARQGHRLTRHPARHLRRM